MRGNTLEAFIKVERIKALLNVGLSGAEIAWTLTISPGYVSQVKCGRIKCETVSRVVPAKPKLRVPRGKVAQKCLDCGRDFAGGRFIRLCDECKA
jgi:hypothetical protein